MASEPAEGGRLAVGSAANTSSPLRIGWWSNHVTWLVLAGLLAALGLLFFFPPDHYPFYPRCLFHTLTGWQCPGCGGLRATHRLLHGDISAAFRLNPLFVLVLPVVLVAAVARVVKIKTGQDWLQRFRRPFWLWILLGLIVVFGVGRNLVPAWD